MCIRDSGRVELERLEGLLDALQRLVQGTLQLESLARGLAPLFLQQVRADRLLAPGIDKELPDVVQEPARARHVTRFQGLPSPRGPMNIS